MKEQAVADFVGRYVVDPSTGVNEEPSECRVVMSKRRLVIAGSDRKTIPLSSVVDVVVGNVPPDLRDLFDDTVTVAYEADDGKVETVLIEASSDTISQFTNVLFKCLLNGTEGVTKHPAQVGGRVTDTDATPAKISIDSRKVDITTPSEDFRIDISTVVDFDRGDTALAGTKKPTLAVKHADDAQMVTSLIAPDSARRMNLLGRYLRMEYSQVRREIEDIQLSQPEKRILVTVYTTGGDIDFTKMLDGNAAQATNILNSLREKDLIDEGNDGISLTSQGQIIVTQRLEDVNV